MSSSFRSWERGVLQAAKIYRPKPSFSRYCQQCLSVIQQQDSHLIVVVSTLLVAVVFSRFCLSAGDSSSALPPPPAESPSYNEEVDNAHAAAAAAKIDPPPKQEASSSSSSSSSSSLQLSPSPPPPPISSLDHSPPPPTSRDDKREPPRSPQLQKLRDSLDAAAARAFKDFDKAASRAEEFINEHDDDDDDDAIDADEFFLLDPGATSPRTPTVRPELLRAMPVLPPPPRRSPSPSEPAYALMSTLPTEEAARLAVDRLAFYAATDPDGTRALYREHSGGAGGTLDSAQMVAVLGALGLIDADANVVAAIMRMRKVKRLAGGRYDYEKLLLCSPEATPRVVTPATTTPTPTLTAEVAPGGGSGRTDEKSTAPKGDWVNTGSERSPMWVKVAAVARTTHLKSTQPSPAASQR